MVSGFSQSTGMPRSRQALTCSSWAAPGRGDQHRVDVGVADRLDRVGHHPGADRAGDLGRLVGEEVVDHRDLGAPDPLAQRVHVKGAHHADAETAIRSQCPSLMSCLRRLDVAPLQELR